MKIEIGPDTREKIEDLKRVLIDSGFKVEDAELLGHSVTLIARMAIAEYVAKGAALIFKEHGQLEEH